jgi:hypothetical protein
MELEWWDAPIPREAELLLSESEEIRLFWRLTAAADVLYTSHHRDLADDLLRAAWSLDLHARQSYWSRCQEANP